MTYGPATAAQAVTGAGSGPSPARTLTVVSAATALALMVYNAVMVTLPATAASLHTPASAQAWLLNGTPLGLAAALLVAGSLADDYGHRRVFLSGTVGLALATAAGAMATSTWMFTLARVAQGVASAALLAASLGLLVHAYPTAQGRRRATGVWGASISAGTATGPVLAGAMPGWRLAYAVLAALVALVALACARTLAESRSPRPGRADLLGAAVFGLALVCLVAALTLGRAGFLRTPVVLLTAAALAGLGVFALVERRARNPLIDLALLRQRPFLGSAAAGLFAGLAVISLFSYLPTLFERLLGLSPMEAAGLFLLWAGLSAAVALQTRRLGPRFTPSHLLACGFTLHAIGALTLLGAFGSQTWQRLLPCLLISGIGTGLLNAALPQAAVESVPPDRAAMGSGAQQTFRYIGSCTGVALTIVLATTEGRSATTGADLAIGLSAGLALIGALAVLLLRTRPAR
ncbi:MFS transporter [Streptomyces sp. NPDC058401]|uniref:MFS transporter n=1 Tax=Streptomyces sp. NPDC058401 TaxID=3346480 RepID=UPI0036479FBD